MGFNSAFKGLIFKGFNTKH